MSISNYPLPSWYYRLAPQFKSGGVVLPWTFDEDISDLDEMSRDETNIYDGPDAICFRQLRDKREERKQELQRRKDFIQKQKEISREEEMGKVREVQMAYETLESSMLKGNMPDLGLLDATFELYSLDYFDHLYDPTPAGSHKKYLKFQCAEGQGPENAILLEGVLWLNHDVESEIAPFYPPSQPSLKHYRLDTIDGRFSLIVQFIDEKYLTLRVSRDLVFMNRPQEASEPETFLFGGIRNDRGKLLQEYRKVLAQESETSFSVNTST
jgi:hypothetical protein